eukprot:1590091-Prymnesium_polylepis.2
MYDIHRIPLSLRAPQLGVQRLVLLWPLAREESENTTGLVGASTGAGRVCANGAHGSMWATLAWMRSSATRPWLDRCI